MWETGTSCPAGTVAVEVPDRPCWKCLALAFLAGILVTRLIRG